MLQFFVVVNWASIYTAQLLNHCRYENLQINNSFKQNSKKNKIDISLLINLQCIATSLSDSHNDSRVFNMVVTCLIFGIFSTGFQKYTDHINYFSFN